MAADQNRSTRTLEDERMETNGPVYVTQPYLPPLEEFIVYLEKIWETKKLTNSWKMHCANFSVWNISRYLQTARWGS